jgi:ABC-type sulfate/molybdate transport systems ATPase subunit
LSAALHVQDLVVRLETRRGRFELSIDELELRAGCVLAVLGPNGSGKTTLLRALAGLVRPAAGSLVRTGAGPVTMVFQRPIAFAGTVAHNVRVALLGARLDAAERRRRVADALRRFGIDALAERRAHRLSGGELRRLALARAFALRPSVLLLDEPFEDLDAATQRVLSADLREAIRGTHVAVALVTHDLRHAVSLADHMAVLAAGRLEQVDSPQRVLAAPATPMVARTVGMSNLVPGEIVGGAVRIDAEHSVAPRECNFPDGAPVWLGLRPEHVKLGVGGSDSAPIGRAIVKAVLSDGILTHVTLDWAGQELEAYLLSGRGLARTIATGDEVRLSVSQQDAHVLPRGL